MTENEFMLADRLTKIQATINQYGIDNFYISYSGGKDSTVLSVLVDIALPYNNIPRVYANTGIEYRMISDFVKAKTEKDSRFEIINPSVPIRTVLEEYGYPFKSKEHALYVDVYQRHGMTKTANRYLNPSEDRKAYGCPAKLRYQFTDECKLRISDKCCWYLKEEPLKRWQENNGRNIAIVGIRASEGGAKKQGYLPCVSRKTP